MAIGHLKYNPQTSTHGKFVQSAVTSLKQGKRTLAEVLGFMAQMVDGDTANAANYTYLATALGCPDNATAKGIFDELNSLNGKITTDASVSFVNAAIEQAFNKLAI